jgi:hypothetical protein
MIKNPNARRILSVVLVVAGGVLIFLAPEQVWIGGVMAALGIGMEFIAIAVGHRRKDSAN